MKLEDIFKNIEGREWDWFGEKVINSQALESSKENSWYDARLDLGYQTICVSLADLLANQSWCKAVWGEEKYEGELIYEFNSWKAFKTLKQKGFQEAVDYIYKTMNK